MLSGRVGTGQRRGACRRDLANGPCTAVSVWRRSALRAGGDPAFPWNMAARACRRCGRRFSRASETDGTADRGARGSSCRSVVIPACILRRRGDPGVVLTSPGSHPDPPGGEGSWWVALRSTSTGACLHSVLSAGPGVVVYHHCLSLVRCRWSAVGYERARINREP